MIKLNESGVIFDQDAHTYSLDNKLLQGITGMIGRQLFPNKYIGISQSIIDKAAARGSMVHEQIELFDAGIIKDVASEEIASYISIKEEYNLTTISNEYLVTDREYFASAIDIVFTNSNGIVLTDIKTTYKLDEEYVKWQLSIYAYFFELQNPKLKVTELRALWLRGDKSKYVLIERIPKDIIQSLLLAEVNGIQFSNPYMPLTITEYPVQIVKAEHALIDLDNESKAIEQNRKAIMDGLLSIMKDNNIKFYYGQEINLTRKYESTRESIDSKKLKDEFPDVYEKCKKTSIVKESLTLKIK